MRTPSLINGRLYACFCARASRLKVWRVCYVCTERKNDWQRERECERERDTERERFSDINYQRPLTQLSFPKYKSWIYFFVLSVVRPLPNVGILNVRSAHVPVWADARYYFAAKFMNVPSQFGRPATSIVVGAAWRQTWLPKRQAKQNKDRRRHAPATIRSRRTCRRTSCARARRVTCSAREWPTEGLHQ